MTKKVVIMYECEHPNCDVVEEKQKKPFLGIVMTIGYPKGFKKAYDKMLCNKCASFEAFLEKDKKEKFLRGRVRNE